MEEEKDPLPYCFHVIPVYDNAALDRIVEPQHIAFCQGLLAKISGKKTKEFGTQRLVRPLETS
jgi:hypothetical protein